MSKISTQPYKGTRDFYPEDMRLRNYIFEKWREVCQSFGYEEYDSPVIEPLELYTAKTSEEIVEQQTFSFEDRGGRKVTLRPEMTPSVSRMVAAKRQELGYPLRLFSIPNCFRYERMQRGRMREFWQLNADLFGVEGIAAEIEVLLLTDKLMKAFGATENMYEIRINSRQQMNAVIKDAQPKVDTQEVIRLIDAFDKLSPEVFREKLAELVEESKVITDYLDGNVGPSSEVETLLNTAKEFGIGNVRYVPSIARGFDYYTDVVFEVFDLNPENNRAMFGGGRYDGLVGQFGVEPVPTIGIAPGDVTMMNFLESHQLMPKLLPSTTKYLMSESEDVIALTKKAEELRLQGENVAVDYTTRKIDKQFKSAKKLGLTDEQIENFEINN